MQKIVSIAFAFFLTVSAFAQNRPPVIFPNLVVPLKAKSTQKINLADKKYSMDPDGDTLTFTFAGQSPSWMSLQSDGMLDLKPTAGLSGKVVVAFTVSDNLATTQEDITFDIAEAPPTQLEWTHNPIPVESKSSDNVSVSIVAFVKNPDGVSLTFSLLKGPAWAKVSAQGILTSTQKPPVGNHRMLVQAEGGGQKIETELLLQIKTGTAPPTKAAMYHLMMLANMGDPTQCSLMREGIRQLIIDSFKQANIHQTILHHRCNTAGQYYGRVIAEAVTQADIDRMYAIAKKYHGSYLMQYEMRFQLVNGIDLSRNLTLLKNGSQVYTTGYDGKDTLYSMKAAVDRIKGEDAFIVKGTYGTILSFFQSLFPTKAEQIAENFPLADRMNYHYGVKLDTVKEDVQGFTMSARDIVPVP